MQPGMRGFPDEFLTTMTQESEMLLLQGDRAVAMPPTHGRLFAMPFFRKDDRPARVLHSAIDFGLQPPLLVRKAIFDGPPNSEFEAVIARLDLS